MLDLLRTWMIGVTSAALIAAILSALTPEGTVKKVSKLAAGMLMTVAVLRPIQEISLEDISSYKMQYEAELNDYENSVGTADEKFMNIIIADRTASYIIKRAGEMGIECSVAVTTHKDGDGLYPYPYSAEVTCNNEVDAEKKRQLQTLIETECAISLQRQVWAVQEVSP